MLDEGETDGGFRRVDTSVGNGTAVVVCLIRLLFFKIPRHVFKRD